MKINLTIIFIMILVFLFRYILLKKIINNNRYIESSEGNYTAIPSIKIVNIFFLFCFILLGYICVFSFKIIYKQPDTYDFLSLYIAIVMCFLIGAGTSAIGLHTQYFFFKFGQDCIKYNFKINFDTKKAVKVYLDEIMEVDFDKKYCYIKSKNSPPSKIKVKDIEFLKGHETLKEKLQSLKS